MKREKRFFNFMFGAILFLTFAAAHFLYLKTFGINPFESFFASTFSAASAGFSAYNFARYLLEK